MQKKQKISEEDRVKISNQINYYRTLPKNVRDSAGSLKPKESKLIYRCPKCDCLMYRANSGDYKTNDPEL